MGRIWLVTGAASGLGREIARVALDAGDTVVLADRRTEGAGELASAHPGRAQAVGMDVTDPERVEAVVDGVIERYGRIDVLVNAAGRGHIGAVEETTEAELRPLMELHFFGPAALTRAVLPHMRERRSGAIVQISSLGGQISVPGMSACSAGKFALEGLSISLAQEVAPLGIKVLIAQPGAMRTNFAGAAISESARIADYEATVGGLRAHVEEVTGRQPGDPVKIATAIVSALADERTPLRLAFGNDTVDRLNEAAKSTQDERDAWEHVTRSTDFTDV
ncbi:oxidoreductase [Streptomyces cadmiisoli]|uniref:Short-chain dehydrogenase/reductase n=1 Tax=Streptomyces cadmiisoli TaxID=2184053 RepID=A0A2Z4J8J8_9ACTN|nr:oxidoreductase [Streptomyces cadmiisoli]AWW41356.1 short-chain dehydrogenase/reductase [Streptomyces cadmiisoli]